MRPSPYGVPDEFVDVRYHRRCGIHVQTNSDSINDQFQTLLLAHCPITIIASLLAIGLGVVLIFYPNLHHKSPIYRQLLQKGCCYFHLFPLSFPFVQIENLQHYSRTKTNSYVRYYETAIFTWIAVHALHLITVGLTVLGTQLIRPRLLVPQLMILVVLVGFFTLAILAIITLNAIGSRLTWVSGLISLLFCFFTATNLYLLVLTHRYVADRREIIQRILANTKTVTFKETHS
uniref:MARVEL domain-containing protein n=1 Tax=Ascaris lumbricoides TaxID=6252 RepID=A0A0M3HZW9_ASCLU